MQYNAAIENIQTRAEAKQLYRSNRKTVIGLVGLMLLITFALDGLVTVLTGGSPMPETQYINTGTSIKVAYNVEPNLTTILSALATLLVMPLTLGLHASMIDICNREPVGVKGLFSRLNLWLKAIGLSLWIYLKTFAWVLLGILVMSTGVTVGALLKNEAVMALMTVAGVIAMCVLVIPALFRYSLAPFIMAENPNAGIRESVNFSKGLMKGHKWQFFKLNLPYVFKGVGAMIVGLIVILLLGGLLKDPRAIQTMMNVALVPLLIAVEWVMLPSYLANALFYLKRVNRAPQEPQEETVPET